MQSKNNIIKKVFFVGATFMILSCVQSHAGTITLNGAVDYVMDGFPVTTLATDSPVSLQLTWDDSLVNATGPSDVVFDSPSNTMTFSVGSISIYETDKTVFDYSPVAHFTDGVFDGFFLSFYSFPATYGGVSGSWSVDAFWNFASIEPIFSAGTNSGFEFYIFEENSFTEVDGHLNPVPVPGALWLLGSGLLGLVGIRRKIS